MLLIWTLYKKTQAQTILIRFVMGGMFKELCVLFAKNKKIEKFSLKNM
jgi:hypothetical protein